MLILILSHRQGSWHQVDIGCDIVHQTNKFLKRSIALIPRFGKMIASNRKAEKERTLLLLQFYAVIFAEIQSCAPLLVSFRVYCTHPFSVLRVRTDVEDEATPCGVCGGEAWLQSRLCNLLHSNLQNYIL